MNIKNLLTLSLVFFMMPNYIFAQDDESADVEEVIVTATKRETNLMETPLAVSVITQEQMALQGLSRISDLSSLVPNLVVGNSGEDSGVSIAIHQGGPGVLVWMWVTALIGATIKFFSCSLAVSLRE